MDLNKTIFETKLNGLTWEEIGRRYNLTSEAARKRSFRFRLKTGYFKPIPTLTPFTAYAPKMSAQTRAESPLEILHALQTYYGYQIIYPTPMIAEKTVRKVVAAGDFHGNPHRAMLAAIVKEQPDIFVGGGDFYDFHQASPHPELSVLEAAHTVDAETTRLRACFDFIALNLPNTLVKLFRGNHDDWIRRKAKELLAPYPYLLPFFNDPYDVLLAGLPENFQRVKHQWQYEHHGIPMNEYAETEYMYILGDVLFSHANFTGGNEGEGVRKLKAKFVDRWRGHLSGLDKLRVFVQFHGHKIAHLKPNGGSIHLIEPGMAASPSTMDYQLEYNLKWSPGALGGVVLEQELVNGEWITMLDSVRLLNPRF